MMSAESPGNQIHVWGIAARPKTLPAGIVPVIVGGVIAYDAGAFHFLSLVAALFGSIMIQIGTNFANDLFDFRKQTDTADRIGPTRVTQAGLATPRQTATATTVAFSLAALAGIYLIYRGGLPILIVGVVSIACGILYTAGPVALGYLGLGDIFVLIFYGPVALAGTFYVQAHDITWPIILAGLPFGMISTAILVVNNLRDIDTDKNSSKKTLAVRFGRTFARYEFLILLIGAAAVPVLIVALGQKDIYLLLPVLYLIAAPLAIKIVFTSTDGEQLNKTLAVTGRLLMIFGFLFSIGWLI
jgi:1,4-dihydroxy-2-naphthoate octaprenyltransferase